MVDRSLSSFVHTTSCSSLALRRLSSVSMPTVVASFLSRGDLFSSAPISDMDAFSSVPVSQIVTGAQKHPGDFAGAQATLDWHKSTRAELKVLNLIFVGISYLIFDLCRRKRQRLSSRSKPVARSRAGWRTRPYAPPRARRRRDLFVQIRRHDARRLLY